MTASLLQRFARTLANPQPAPRYGMVIDTTKCIGCESCTVACKAENNAADGHWRTRIMVQVTSAEQATPTMRFVKWACMHCANAPCVTVCPTRASHHLADGTVVVDEARCVGCKYCVAACPYGARYFDEERGLPDKCDRCQARLAQGLAPACVTTCVGRAISFGDLDDPESDVSKLVASGRARPLHPEFGTKPTVYYIMTR